MHDQSFAATLQRLRSLGDKVKGRGKAATITPGRAIAAGSDPLRSIAVVCVDLSEDRLREVLQYVFQMQTITKAFAPIIYTDRPIFGIVREYGWPIEFVMDQRHHVATCPERDWADGVVHQFEELIEMLGVGFVLVPEEGMITLEDHEALCKFVRFERFPLDRVYAGVADGPTDPFTHWSGWASTLPGGNHHVQVRRESGLYDVQLSVVPGAQFTLIAAAGPDIETSHLLAHAREAGWSSSLISPVGEGEGDEKEMALGAFRLCQELSPLAVGAVVAGGYPTASWPSEVVRLIPTASGGFSAEWPVRDSLGGTRFIQRRSLPSLDVLDDLLVLHVV